MAECEVSAALPCRGKVEVDAGQRLSHEIGHDKMVALASSPNLKSNPYTWLEKKVDARRIQSCVAAFCLFFLFCPSLAFVAKLLICRSV